MMDFEENLKINDKNFQRELLGYKFLKKNESSDFYIKFDSLVIKNINKWNVVRQLSLDSEDYQKQIEFLDNES